MYVPKGPGNEGIVGTWSSQVPSAAGSGLKCVMVRDAFTRSTSYSPDATSITEINAIIIILS